jgi:hypothetical protein
MNPKLEFHTYKMISLSLEDFYNKGITPEQAKEVIEGITGQFSCSPTGTNNNWQFQALPSQYCVLKTICEIEYRLSLLLEESNVRT